MTLDAHGLKLNAPFGMILCGQSQTGKTTFVNSLLKKWDDMVDKPMTKLFWLYGQYQPEMFSAISSSLPLEIEFVEGFNVNFLKSCLPASKDCTVVIDDLNREAFSEPYFASLFDRVSHHCKCNVIAVSQNIYDPGKFFRQAMLNTKYLVLMSCARDKRSLTCLNSQIFPDHTQFLTAAYNEAVEGKPYGHLLIDTSPYQLEEFRVRSKVFNADTVFHVPLSTMCNQQYDLSSCYSP